MKKIELKIKTIQDELFTPSLLELSVQEVLGEYTKIFVELTQFYPEPNYGVCKRSRYFTIPTSLVESLQLNWKGDVQNNQALIDVLSQFNLELSE